MFRLLFLILVYLTSCKSLASFDDEVAEMSGRIDSIKSINKKEQGTWLPVPIPISNPTIGTGLQATLLYLHPKDSADPTVLNPTSGIVGMYTDSDSWFSGGFHDGNWENDLYRFRVLGGSGKFNLDYFGIGDDSNLRDNPIPYSISTDVVFTQFLTRFPGSEDWYAGFRYSYIRSNVSFDEEANPELPTVTNNMVTSSLGLVANFDSRDNNYYPTKGSYFELVLAVNDEAIGSDFDFTKLTSFYNHYLPVTNKSIIAVKVNLADTNGDVPFYLLPTLRLRGFPAGRYKDNSILSVHTEWRHKPVPRWGYILFVEAGRVANTLDNIPESETITAYGGGVRWQVTEDKLLNLGLDVGFSDSDSAIYVNIGERF
jgi:outer membrane protein assembly factor BamA